jgi:exonuclease III
MSSAGKNNQYMKIYGIAKLRSDIICLSDVRLCSRNMISAGNDVEHIFLHNPYASYDCHFNSSKNKRGVAILIKKNAIFQFYVV